MRELLRVRPARHVVLGGLLLAAVLLPLDLARQLPVRDDPSHLHAFLVDALGVLMAAVGQLLLIGYARDGRCRSGPGAAWAAVRRRPAVVVAGLLLAGAVSAVLTVPVSVAVLGAGQVLGPLHGPSLFSLSLAGLSDAVATAVTAPWFAALVVRTAAEDGQRTG